MHSSTLFLHANFQLVVMVLLTIVPLISAIPNPSQPLQREVHIREPVVQKRNKIPDGWSLRGCYTNDPERPTLTSIKYSSDVMTIENCVNSCDGAHYLYAGLENGVDCHCGNSMTVGTNITEPSDCNTTCAGNRDQKCGGNLLDKGHMSLYSSWWEVQPPPQPTFVLTVGKWSLMGCYSDSDDARTLSVQKGDHLDVGDCCKTCEASGFRMAGLEFANECWCGNSIQNGAMMLDKAYCPLACSADSTQMCGGSHSLVMYHDTSKS